MLNILVKIGSVISERHFVKIPHIVYATDAQTENTNGDDKEVEIVATAEDSMMQTPVIYPVGTVASSAHKDEAKAFEDFLQTDEAKAILAKAGFTINK